MSGKEPYSNREINAFFEGIDGKLDRVIEQTTKHNSRLTRVEYKQAMFVGGLSVISVVVVPIALWVLTQII